VFEHYTLKNGMEVILVPRAESPATTVMATVKVGSKYETKDISGLSHFLEHMAFKGTKQYPLPSDISTELDGLGAHYNAFTNEEWTAYYAKVRNDAFDKALNIIADMYLNPTVPAEELEKERGVIIEEINMYEDMPMWKVDELFSKVLYGDQPAGWSVAGRKEVVQRVQRDEFLAYRAKHYTSGNTIITVAGGYNPADVKEKIAAAFRGIMEAPDTPLPDVREKQSRPQEIVMFKESDQAHLVLGFRAFDAHDARHFPLMVLADLLGGGMSSRLFKHVRDELGLAYYIDAETHLFTNNGFVAARAGVAKDRVGDALRAIVAEFKELTERSVGEDELKKTRAHLIGGLFLSLETSDQLASFYTGQRVMNLAPLMPEDVAERIERVTAADIQAVARDLFTDDRLNLAALGPFKGESFGDILHIS